MLDIVVLSHVLSIHRSVHLLARWVNCSSFLPPGGWHVYKYRAMNGLHSVTVQPRGVTLSFCCGNSRYLASSVNPIPMSHARRYHRPVDYSGMNVPLNLTSITMRSKKNSARSITSSYQVIFAHQTYLDVWKVGLRTQDMGWARIVHIIWLGQELDLSAVDGKAKEGHVDRRMSNGWFQVPRFPWVCFLSLTIFLYWSKKIKDTDK